MPNYDDTREQLLDSDAMAVLGLSVRAKNGLCRCLRLPWDRYDKEPRPKVPLRDVIALSETRLFRTKNLGRKSVEEIKAALKSVGLFLHDDDSDAAHVAMLRAALLGLLAKNDKAHEEDGDAAWLAAERALDATDPK